MNLLKRRIEQQESLSARIDAEHTSRSLGADEKITGLVDCQRRGVSGLRLVERRALPVRSDLVDNALLAGGGVHVALRVGGERPDIFVVGVEEGGRFSGAVDLVHLP